jgi:putative phosphoesterase
MRILIISDVHGNLPALEYVLNVNKDVDLIISLGDVVNYGPWSNECVQLLNARDNVISLRGNHEISFLDGFYSGKNHIAHSFFNFCYPRFSEHSIIDKYNQDFFFNNCRFTHSINDLYIFSDTEITLTENTFIGHSHQMFLKYNNGFRLVNAGSVGQNRKNLDEVNFVIWDTKNNNPELFTRKFDSKNLIHEMKNSGYPELCINYILSKKIG